MAENLKKLSSAGLEARLDAAWAAGDDELAAAVSAELARRSEYASPDAEAALAEFYGVYAGEPLTSSKRVRRMKKRKWLAAVAALFVLLLAGTLLSPQRVLATGVQESGNSIKVFVGTRSDMFGWLYDFYQRAQINGFYRDDSEGSYPALVTFDGFYDPDSVREILAGMDSIDKVYAWTPGETGRAIISLQPGQGIEEAAERTYRLTGERGIFAAEVTGSAAELKALYDAGYDVLIIYSEKAERLSAETGKRISYVCVPDKPDGTS